MSKHEEIINYIISLETGSKISVRRIATELNVSEGTAYRAIKDCDSMGIVTTIPRVGTIKIESLEKKAIEELTYAEVVNITDGTVLGGKDGLHKTLNKFVIGAMTVDAMEKYISPTCLFIVGNREDAQKLALENEAAVLISGGFGCSEAIKKLANEKCLPVISSTYDSFTIASMINKAISESLIKKDIILVEDIMKTEPLTLKITDTVEKWKQITKETNQDKYPVIDNNNRVTGIVTLKDMRDDLNPTETLGNIMSRGPITVTPKTTVAYTAHIMGWEDIEICPVVDNKQLVGVIDRQDVIKALQYALRQPQVGENLEDLILRNFEYKYEDDKMHFWGRIVPEMLDPIGTASWGSLNMLLSTAGVILLRHKNNINISVDSIMTYFMKPVQMDRIIDIHSEIIDMRRNFCKVAIDMQDANKEIIAKVMLSAKVLKK